MLIKNLLRIYLISICLLSMRNCHIYCVRCVIIAKEDLFSSQGPGPSKQQGGVSGEDMMNALEEFRRRRGLNEKVIFDGAPDKTIVTIMACSGWHGRRIK